MILEKLLFEQIKIKYKKDNITILTNKIISLCYYKNYLNFIYNGYSIEKLIVENNDNLNKTSLISLSQYIEEFIINYKIEDKITFLNLLVKYLQNEENILYLPKEIDTKIKQNILAFISKDNKNIKNIKICEISVNKFHTNRIVYIKTKTSFISYGIFTFLIRIIKSKLYQNE